jgi:mxaC protein
MMSFAHPGLLWLLPLALAPLIVPAGRALPYSWLALMPRDRASDALRWVLRAAACLALAAVIVALAGPYRPEYRVERIGKGAEIVLVLDRSRSMDQGFAGGAAAGGKPPAGTGPEALDYYMRRQQSRGESKNKVARQVLSEFAAKRPEDRFGMIVFSTLPIRVLDFTQKSDVIQAAIEAGNIGRGLSETDIGLALQSALSYFEDRPYTGSRIVLLVSDGGDHLTPDAQARIRELARKHRVALYWIYIRSANSPGLAGAGNVPAADLDSVPEYSLHRFFESMGTPYRAYEAENPEALQKAVDDVDRLENLPIAYFDTVPRRDVSPGCYAAGLACVLLLLGANFMELRQWR